MVYRRRRYRRTNRGLGRRRSRFSRRSNRRRFRRRSTAYKSIGLRGTYSFVRTMGRTGPAVTGSSSLGFTYNFFLNQLSGNTEFLNLFEQYKINCVVVKFLPKWGINTTPGTSTYGKVFIAPDYNDSAPVVDENEMMQKQGVRLIDLTHGRPFSYKIAPRYLIRAYESVTNDAFKPARGWINTDDPDAPHYGIKMWWSGANVALSMDMYVKFYITCRGVK